MTHEFEDGVEIFSMPSEREWQDSDAERAHGLAMQAFLRLRSQMSIEEAAAVRFFLG